MRVGSARRGGGGEGSMWGGSTRRGQFQTARIQRLRWAVRVDPLVSLCRSLHASTGLDAGSPPIVFEQ